MFNFKEVREFFEQKVTITVTEDTIKRRLIWHGNGEKRPVRGMLGWTIGIDRSGDKTGHPAVVVHRLLSSDRKCFITAADSNGKEGRNVFIDERTEELRFGPNEKPHTDFGIVFGGGFGRIFLTRGDRYVMLKEGEDDSCPCTLVLGPSGEHPSRSPFSLEEESIEFREEFSEEFSEEFREEHREL